ncbi:hypothetical protein F4818DRAFT_451863 [Hypoxylon cercidicola]|nr:hypothetical protein F4818DRAFT_451863 [Hypoxylon cercidicola]
MAEAQQEQPRAHQPQPEPVFAAAEELVHALPHQSLVPSKSSSQATPEQEKSQGAQRQVWLASQATTSDANGSDHERERPNLQSPNNATKVAVVHAQKQEQDQKQDQDQDRDQGREREQAQQGIGRQSPQLSSNHTTATNSNSTSTSTSTSTPTTALPVTVPDTTVAADPATLPTATAATNGVSSDQHPLEDTAPSEAMSNNPPHPHHSQGPPRQATGYSNPTAYATPGMSSAHYGYANPGGQGQDAYRTGASVPNNAMALPSMRTFDPVQQQAQQQQHMAMAMPVNPVPSVPSMSAQQHMTYFGQQPVPMAANNPYALPADALRPQYALPPSGPVLGGRHKKSKRECLGYDPIFKNQQQQHPTNIRPAPNTAASVPSTRPPTSAPSASASASASVSGTHTQTQTQTPAPYATLPPVIPNTTTSSSTSPFTGNLTAPGTAASAVKNEHLEYPPAIDPSLDNVLTSSMSASHFPAIKPITPSPADHTPYTQYSPHLRGGGPSFVPLSSPLSHPTPSFSHQRTPAYTGFSARKMKVHELVGMSGAVPPPLDSPLTSEKLAEVGDLYDQVYAPGLEKFFETEWYIKSEGVNALMSNAAINEMLAGFLQSMARTDANDVAGMQYSANLEFRVVWDLASLVYTSEYKASVGDHLPSPEDGSEARNRVAVFEALLSGEHLDQNPLHPPPASADIRLHRIREFKFWYSLAEFLRLRDHPNLDIARQREYILGQMRELLDGRENRDVLYSLAIIRALAPNFPPDFESTLPPHLDETDPKNKLAVARKFIQDESQVTGGTTNVVRRFSELAVRAFIVPGNNITRR